MSNACIVC